MQDTIKLKNKGNTKMIGHMGLSGLERENTCPSFLAAANRSYFGIETDVHACMSGELILIHDFTTDRISNGKYSYHIEKTPYSTLRELRLPDRDGSTFRGDLYIPLLAEYISTCKRYGKRCVLEIKDKFTEENILKVIDCIKEFDYLENMIFITFELEDCRFIRKQLPEAKIQYLRSSYSENLPQILLADKLDLDIYYTALTKEIIDDLHSKGIEVNAWTVDDPAVAEKLISMGIDYITTDILE